MKELGGKAAVPGFFLALSIGLFPGARDVSWTMFQVWEGDVTKGQAQVREAGAVIGYGCAALDAVVRVKNQLQGSLTLLGRAYYNTGNYEVARQILQRALLVNKDDEIAWMALGLAQLRLGEDDKGIETLQGAITLISKVSKSGYRDFNEWDSKALVRTYISRSAVDVRKGTEAKASIRDANSAFRMDEEENYQKQLKRQSQIWR